MKVVLMPLRYALFDTAIGRCGLAWTARGIARVQLPEAEPARSVARLSRGGADESEPPAWVAEVIRGIQTHLAGEPQDFSKVPLDLLAVEDFPKRVYDAARGIEAGRTATYGEIAEIVGAPDARAVGRALAANPCALIVPCHRVVAANGRMGGFSAPGGVMTKAKLLAIEGVGLELGWA